MRFIIVLGVLLYLVQLVAGAKLVQCVEAEYNNGKWTPIEDARIGMGKACEYEVQLFNCAIRLKTLEKLWPEDKMDCSKRFYAECKCDTDKCNGNLDNLRKVKNLLELPKTPEPQNVGNPTSTENPENPQNPQIEIVEVPKQQVEEKFCEKADFDEIINHMPKYDTLSPRKTMRCSYGMLFQNDEWTDVNDLDIKAKSEGCLLGLGYNGECVVHVEGIKRLQKAKCENLNNAYYCSCDRGDDCHMEDIKKTVGDAEKLVKDGKMSPEFAKCLDKWKAVPTKLLPTTTTPKATATDAASATSGIQVLVITASTVFFSYL